MTREPMWRRYLRFWGTDVDADVDDEIECHLDLRVEELIAEGWTPDQARAEAQRRFGNVEAIRDRCRAIGQRQARRTRRLHLLDELRQDLGYALRQLARRPGFGTGVVLILALSVGPTIVIFSWANILLDPLPIPDSDRVVAVWSFERERGSTRLRVSVPDYVYWRDHSQSFEELATLSLDTSNVIGLGEPMRVPIARASSNLFTAWQVAPTIGRPFNVADTRPGSPPVVILSDQFWRQHLSGRSDIIGRTLRLDGREAEIVGITAPGLQTKLLSEVELWVPQTLDPDPAGRSRRSLMVIGRLRPDTSVEQAHAEIGQLAGDLARAYPDTNARMETRVLTLPASMAPLMILTPLGGSVAFLILIACANVANLMLAQGATRVRELAIRSALGAGRFRLVRQLIVESLVLAVTAGVLGLSFAALSLRLLVFDDMVIDHRVLQSTVWLVLVMPFVFGLIPALQASRVGLIDGLKAGVHGVTRRRYRLSKPDLLVVSQVALAVTLLVVVGQTARTSVAIANVEPGFDSANLLTFRIELPASSYPTPESVRTFQERVIQEVAALPDVVSVAATDHLPVADRETTLPLAIEAAPDRVGDTPPQAARALVSADYLATLGVPLLRGRALSNEDSVNAVPVAVIGETMGRRHWAGEDPIGQRIRLGSGDTPEEWIEIVGVAGDVRNSDVDAPLLSQVYLPITHDPPRRVAFVMRTRSEPARAVASIRQAVAKIDSVQPIYGVSTMEQVIFDDLKTTYVMIGLFATLGVIALTLAAAGLHGLLWYLVAQRTREFGIRLALGASPRALMAMVIGRGGLLVLVGSVIGLGAGSLIARSTAAVLSGMWLPGATVFLTIPLLVAAVMLVASYFPARRATRVDPLVALKAE